MTRGGPRWRPFLIIWALLSLMTALWSLATPIGAAPDEPAHFIKAASVARGQWIGEQSPIGSVVRVPAYVAFTQSVTCFAFHDEVTADCSPRETGDPGATTTAATTAGLYNPVYYALVGWPSLIFHDQSGLYVMRMVGGLLSSLFLALAAVQLLALRRPTIPLLAFAVAVTPMLIFLGSAVNPNALESAAVLSCFVTVFMVVRHPDPSLLPARSVTLMVSAAVALTMRGLSPLWVAIVLVAPLLLLSRDSGRALLRSRWVRATAIVVGAVALFAVIWILATNSLSATYSASASQAPGIGASPLQGFLFILFGTFGYAQGLVGVFGWLDTPAPIGVFFAWSAFVGVLLLLGAMVLRGRARLLMLLLLLAMVLLPPALQAVYIHSGGIIWQGRYALPLFLCLVLALGLLLGEAIPDLDWRMQRILVVAVTVTWAFCQVYSFGTALRRYSVGLTGDLTGMVAHPAWSPPGGILALISLFTLVCVIAAVVFARRAIGTAEPDGADGMVSLSTSV